MTEINNDLIRMIRELNQLSSMIDEDDQVLDDVSSLSDEEKMNNFDEYTNNLKKDLSKINERLDLTEDLIFKIVKIEPDPVLRSLHVSLTDFLDKEDYEKCHELSNKIKNYK